MPDLWKKMSRAIFSLPGTGRIFWPATFSHVRYLEPTPILHLWRIVARGGFHSVANCARSSGDFRSNWEIKARRFLCWLQSYLRLIAYCFIGSLEGAYCNTESRNCQTIRICEAHPRPCIPSENHLQSRNWLAQLHARCFNPRAWISVSYRRIALLFSKWNKL